MGNVVWNMNTINVYQTADEKKIQSLTWKIEREIDHFICLFFSIPLGRVLIEMHLVFILVIFLSFFIIIVHDYCWLALASTSVQWNMFCCLLLSKESIFAIDDCVGWLRVGEGHENWFQSQEMDFSSYSLIFFSFSFWNLPMNVKIIYMWFSVCS